MIGERLLLSIQDKEGGRMGLQIVKSFNEFCRFFFGKCKMKFSTVQEGGTAP